MQKEINYVQTGQVHACGHCQPDKGFDLPEKYGVKCECKCHNKEEWENEFDKKFRHLGTDERDFEGTIDKTEVKDFIKQTLSKERADIREKIKKTFRGCACGLHGYQVLPDCDKESHKVDECARCLLQSEENK